jgi:hypothetical protein
MGFEGSGCGPFEVPSWHFLEVLKETMKNHRVADVPAEIQTEHLPSIR